MKNITLTNKLAQAVVIIAKENGIIIPATTKMVVNYIDGRIVVEGTAEDKAAVKMVLKVAFDKVIEVAGRLDRKEFENATAEEAVAKVAKMQAARAAKNVAKREALKATRAARMEATKARLAQQKAVKATLKASMEFARKMLIVDDKTAAAFAYNLYNEQFIKSSRREMMRKDKAVNILGLAATAKDGVFEFVKQELAEQRITRKEGLLDVQEMELPIGDLSETFTRATKDFLVVNYGAADSDVLNIRKFVLLKVKHNGANTEVLAAYLVKEDGKLVKKYLDMKTMVTVKPSEEELKAYDTYAMVGSTAAGSRTGSVYYYKQGIAIDEILNYSSYGAWNKMLAQKLHVSVVNKNLVRIFAGFSSNVNGGSVENYAIYFGNMGNVEGNKQPLDGMLFNSLDLASSAINALLGVKAPLSVARKFAGQVRPFTTKCFSKTVNRSEMKVLMSAIAGGEDNIVKLQREDITPEIEAQLDLGFKGKGQFAGKLVIVGDAENVQILTDTNGYKAPFDYKLVSEFSILDLPTDTSAKTSIQLWEKMLVADLDKTTALIQELIEESCAAEIEALATMKVKVPSLKEVQAGYVHGLTKAIDPDYVTSDRRSYLAEINDTKTRIEKMLNKMKFAVDGLNARIHADYAAIFGKTFIAADKVLFANKVAKRLAKEGITQVIGIKYPSVGIKEYFDAKVVSAKDLEAMVRADQDLSGEQKACLISMYKNTNDGVAVIGAFGALKDWLAGLDFDYDMICFFFDKRITEILSGQSKEMVSFDESYEVEGYDKEAVARRQESLKNKRKSPEAAKSTEENAKFNKFMAAVKTVATKQEKAQTIVKIESVTNELDEKEVMINLEITFNADSSHNAFCMFFSFKGVNVGAITNNDLTQVLAMLDTKVMKAMMLRAYKAEPKNAKPYVGLPCEDVEISEGYVVKRFIINGALAAKMADEIKTCARDEESLIKIFRDLNIVYRYYQELAIDAAKTFIAPFLELILAKGFKPAILQEATFENPSVEITIDNFDADYEAGSLARSYTFNDPLNQLRETALVELKEAFDALASQEFASPQVLREYWAERLTDNIQIEGINYLTALYRRVTAHYARLTAGLDLDSPLRAMYNKEKRFYFQAIRNMFVAMTPELNDQMRGSLAKTLNYFQAVSVKGTNRYTLKERANEEGITPIAFAESVLGYEYFANVCASKTAVPFAGERIVSGNVRTGATVEFVDGIYRGQYGAAATIVKINGSYEIIEVNGSKYAVKPILEVAEAPEITNHVLVQLKDNQVSDEVRDFLEAARKNDATVAISDYTVSVLDVDFKTTLSGAAKRIVSGQQGVIKSILPMYENAIVEETEDRQILNASLKGLSLVIELDEVATYEAPTAKTVQVATEEESLESLRAKALAALKGEEVEAEGTPTASTTDLSMDDIDLGGDDSVEGVIDTTTDASPVIKPIVSSSFDLDDADEIEL